MQKIMVVTVFVCDVNLLIYTEDKVHYNDWLKWFATWSIDLTRMTDLTDLLLDV